MSELKTWIREPDYAEAFSIAETIDWINRRPIAEVVAIPEWQPIESAPKDGTCILTWGCLYGEGGGGMGEVPSIQCSFWEELRQTFYSDAWGSHNPTHWMPLPAPPACG